MQQVELTYKDRHHLLERVYDTLQNHYMRTATRLEYLLVRWVDSSPRNHQNLYICTSPNMYLRRSCVERIHAHMHTVHFNQDYMKLSFLYLSVNNEWLTGLFTSWKSAYIADWEIFAAKIFSVAKIKRTNISYVKKSYMKISRSTVYVLYTVDCLAMCIAPSFTSIYRKLHMYSLRYFQQISVWFR